MVLSVTPTKLEICSKLITFGKYVETVLAGKVCATVPFNWIVPLPVPASRVPPVTDPANIKIPFVPKVSVLLVLESVDPKVILPVTVKVPLTLIALLTDVALITIVPTVSVNPLFIVSVTALVLPMFILAGMAAGAALMVGWLVNEFPLPILTMSPVPGTAPLDQLLPVFQFDEEVPFQ